MFLRLAGLLAFASAYVQDIGSKFEETIASSVPTFVKFYAPWCGHCKHLAPVYRDLNDAVDPTKVTITEVDCTVAAEVCNTVKLRGYPTIRLYKSGEMIEEYKGERTKDAMLAFLKEHM